MIKVIIFDYDGVLVDSFPGLYAIYKKFSKEFDFVLPELKSFRELYIDNYNYRGLLAALGVEGEEKIKFAENTYSQEIVKFDYQLFEGVREVLGSLRKKYKLIILSANYENELYYRLDKLGIKDYFAEIHSKTGETVRAKHEALEDILAHHGLKASEVVSVGDRNLDHDIARKTGIDNFILTDYGWGYDAEKLDPDTLIAYEPKDILKLIEKIDK